MAQTAKVARTWQIGFGLTLVSCAALGCAANKEIPQDPLFIARKPVEAKAENKPPVAIAFAEPAMPLDAASAIARQKEKTVPGILTSNPQKVPAAPRYLPDPLPDRLPFDGPPNEE
jgi:hypothetical protein